MSDTPNSVSTNQTNTTTTPKTWEKEQDWIKDVLSKSNTDLVQLTTNKLGSLKITKKQAKENEQDSQNNTMVYYQSTPLIVKSEQPSQSQQCSTENQPPLHMQQQYPSVSSYALNNVAITMQQQQQQQQQQQLQQLSPNNCNNTSINNHHQQQQEQYLTNIKTELLPPGITLYATSQQPSPTTLAPINQNVSSSSPTPLPTSTTTSPRKANPSRPKFKCELCGMIFGSKSAHTSHTKSHAKNGVLTIFSGGKSMAPSSTNGGLQVNNTGLPTPQLNINLIIKNDEGNLLCNVCQKKFAVLARLIRHYRTHTGERPFECDFCQKQFSVKENLQVHRRIHTKERPYKCDVCSRAFEHSGKLHRHMRIHTGERPHKCSVCAKTFIQSGQLVIHMRTHTGEKPYKCPVEGCGKGFTCSKQLKVHSRTHTGEKPYHCDICFRDFGYNHVLKLHRVQHYGSKCYKCTICDETFKSKKEMEAHIKGHANEMPDDEEEAAAAVANGSTTPDSTPSTSGVETNSGPNSPQSPSSSVGASVSTMIATKKQRKPRQEKTRSISTSGPLSPGSPGSPSSSMSPSSSYASGSRLSASSPTSSVASTTMSLCMETDNHSRDSGVASGSIPTANLTRQLAAATLIDISHHGSFPIDEEMPTDLSITQQGHQHHQNGQQQQVNYHYQNSPPSPQNHLQPQQYHYLSNSPVQQQTNDLLHHNTSPQPHGNVGFEQPTINPALLEAATIASRREVDVQQADDVQQAAIQIMQLHRSQQKSNSPVATGNSPIYTDLHHGSPNIHHSLITPLNPSTSGRSMIMETYDDSQETNDLIEFHKRGELARHGMVKGYAPVPKFETSEIILRQVEAAIAPLRSSTESPERSSSPESDSSMLMADRDVMTLPLRKRKLYMSDVGESTGADLDNGSAKENEQKAVRQSSVIQFAKAT